MKKRIFTTFTMFVGCLLFLGTTAFAQGGQTQGTAVTVGIGSFTAAGPSAGGGASGICAGGATNAEWFSFSPTDCGIMTVTRSAADPNNTDTRLSLYLSDPCTGLTCIGFNDDINFPTNAGSSASAIVAPGQEILIEWDDRWSTGGFDWDLTFTPSAFTATGNTGETVLDAEVITPATGIANPGITPGTNGGIGGGLGTQSAYWYSYTPTDCGTIDISSSGAIDTRLFLHKVCDSGVITPCSVEFVDSNDDINFPADPGSALTGINVVAGETFLIEWDDRWSSAPFTWDLTFTPSAGCDAAACLGAANETTMSADLSWLDCGVDATIEWGPACFTPGTGTMVTNQTSPFTLTGLDPDTDYSFFVTTNCAGGAVAPISAQFNFSTLPTCVIEPQADITQDTDAGVCEAAVTIPVPVLTGADCNAASLTNDFNNTGDASGTYPIGTTTVTFTASLFSDPTATVTMEFNVTVEDNEDPTITCAVVGAARSADAGVCTYTASGGEFNPTASGDNCPNAVVTNSFNGTDSVDGEAFAVGTTTVTWTITDDAGNETTCDIDVVVEDNEDPIFTSCPTDIIVNLGEGECGAIVDFVVEATDNCPVETAPLSNNNGAVEIDNSLACGAQSSHYVVYDLAAAGATGGFDFTSFDIGINEATGGPTVTANAYALNGAASIANLTLLATSGPIVLPDLDAEMFTFNLVGSVPPGQDLVIELVSPGTTPTSFLPGYNATGVGQPSYISGCGLADMTLTSGIGLGAFSLVATANGQFSGAVAGPNPVEQVDLTGLMSGDNFPIGSYDLMFTSTDASGNSAACNFNVTVNEIANPTTTLAANDNVTVSLDEDGCSIVTPDMILEGGPYGCYEDFYMARTPAFAGTACAAPAHLFANPCGSGNGPAFVSQGFIYVDCSDIGQEIIVSVIDPETCVRVWSTITVEDKLAPTIDCGAPLEVAACDGVADPIFTAPVVQNISVPGVLGDNPELNINGNALGSADMMATAVATVANVPAAGVVTNLTVGIQANHTWVGDLDITLTGPNGQTIELIAESGCANDDVDILMDDNGDPLACFTNSPAYRDVAQLFTGTGALLADFNGISPNGEWTLTVTDNFPDAPGGGVGDGELTGFTLNVEYLVQGAYAPTFSDNCDAALTYVDNFFNLDCFDANGDPDFAGRIERTWTATDGSGNTATCVQVINLTRPTLQSIDFPEDITWQCDQFAEFPNITAATPLNPSITFDATTPALHVNPNTPDNLLANTGSGVATINGSPIIIGDLCEIACDFEDSTIEICPGTTKILRSWVCIDWCAGESVEFNQIIKVVDETGPDLINPGDLEIDVFSASAPAAGIEADCKGNPVVPQIADNGDNCSSIVSYETQIFSVDANGDADELLAVIPTNGGQFFDIELYDANGDAAQYIVCYTAADECGNETEVCVDLTVFDKVPPVAICDEITQISITNSNANGNSCSALAAADLDDGSYDNCTDVHFLISRMNNPDPTSSQNIYTPFEDFCCSDIPGPVQVILLVLDDVAWNIYMNNVDDGNGNLVGYGQIQPDGQLGIRGNRLDLTSDDNGDPRDMDGRWNFCMVEVLVEDKLAPTIVCPPNAALTCDEYADDLAAALLACEDAADEDACQSAELTAAGYGDVTGVDNCSVTTTPTVTVTIDQCGSGSVVRSFSGVDPSGNASNVCTQVITVTHVSDWVVEFPMDQDGFCDQDEPDFGEPEIFFETCELIATSFEDSFFDVVPDACFKIVRQWTVINWCVVGNVIDQEADAVELSEQQINQDLDGDGDRDSRTFRDSYRGVLPTQDNDPDADNQDGFITYQQVIKVQDFDAPVIDPTFSVDDLCIITGNDGTDNDFSDCAFSGVLPTPDYTDCTLDVNGNLDNNGQIVDNQLTITATVFDANGDVVSNSVVVNGLEIGCYVVRYVAIDRCGNTVATDYDFCVNDCKFPTPYCKDGVVLELMHINDPNNTTFEPMVELWAADLDEGSFDNCPGGVQLSFSANVNDIGTTFNCDNLGENAVQMWVTDASGNQDFCETFVIIQANQGQCPGDDPQVQGNVATETNLDVQDVTVAINTTAGFGDAQTTLADGNYNIEVPNNSDVTITPSKDMNPRNGVSTFDLVKISKHILNTESLDSPYKMIAADANNSGTITTLDLVQIRKLILFISDDFANNSSWRFVDAAYNFPNPSNPWAEAFPEVISLNDVTPDALNNNFVAVKIGDVNGSAAANQLLGADDRNMTGALTLTAADVAMKAGETYTVEVSAANFNNFGYQFTMNFDADAMEFVSVGNGLATAENFGLTMLSEGVITASYYAADAVRVAADEAVFTLTFAAKADVQLSEVLSINSRYTAAEAYAANGDVQNVELDFNNGAAVAGFELYQNTPNPFATETSIGFNLGADKAATITISDISGKVVKVIEVDGVKGYNQVVLSRNEVAASGILYYQLDTDTDSATKKMILID